MNLTEQLRTQGNLFARPGRTPKKRKRLNPVSMKRGAAMKEYAKKRKAYLTRGTCEASIVGVCKGKMTEIHHAQGRGSNLNNVNTWVGVCRPCHNWIHSHPKTARHFGLLK